MNNLKATYHICKMHIIDVQNNYYQIKISLNDSETLIKYNPCEKDLIIEQKNDLDRILTENRYQLQKILNNKRPETFYPDFKLKFILRDNFEAVNFNNLDLIVVLDRQNNQYLTYTHNNKNKKIFRIYTDGCHFEKTQQSSCAYISKNLNNKLNIYTEKLYNTNSSLTELIAVIRALQHHKHISELRIVTDSRYIIKGLTEWIFNWKLNDWHTAQGEKVKNIKYWKQFEALSKGKYIEFEWVKAHRQHFENTLCDYYAKEKAVRKYHFKIYGLKSIAEW